MPDESEKLNPEEYRAKLLRELDLTYQGLSETQYLSQIFDRDWYQTMVDEIRAASLRETFRSPRGFMFFQMNCWFRGQDWYELAQQKALDGRVQELTENEKLIFAWFGFDPLKSELPVFERRLTALATVPGQSDRFLQKINQLKYHKHTFEFRNHFFELMVLGQFALQGVLVEMDVPLPSANSTVDGRVRLDGRDLFVEVTFTSQELFEAPPSGPFAVDWYEMFNAALAKIKKKVANGKQLALVNGAPTLLVVGRIPNGPDEFAYAEAADLCFKNAEFQRLSGFLMSDSWKFLGRKLITGESALVPLTSAEAEFLTSHGI